MSHDPGHVGPRIEPGWLDIIRQAVLFGLGVWLIWFAATTNGHDVPFLVTGLVLFGMIPFEWLASRHQSRQSVLPEQEKEQRDEGDDDGDVGDGRT